MRSLYRLVRRISPIHRRAERPFYTRLLDVVYHGFTGIAALLAALIVLYARGDWVLLGIALLFLLGLAWASKATLPQFVDQIRILLNFGTVRELERVVYNGLPWRVSRLSMYALLSNPELSGGIVRLPVKQLTEMRSRPCAADDVWFPSHRNDWVKLSDGRVGQILHQSPESVKLRTSGGSIITYPTQAYLDMNPENLSGGFSVGGTFGIDYAHQAIATTRVPEIMRARLEAAVHAVIPPEDVVRVGVDFVAAGPSSLDFGAGISLKGNQAERFRSMEKLIQRVLVETCNQEGWVIPFPQMTIHQAAPANGAEPAHPREVELQRAQSSR
jgi:small-conductance mechanosensitive channel